jgi:hypothetical protein
MKSRGKKVRGGGSKKLKDQPISFDPLNILLLGVVIFLMYQMSKMLQTEPETIIQEKIVYKTMEESDDQPYRDDIYTPDLRQVRRSPPFNIKTRGPPENYDMVGFLQDPDDTNKLQQLFGRRTYPNSNNWNYYVKSDQYHQIPIPVSINGQNCTDERGCVEVQDQGSLNIFNKDHTATIYKPEPYYYNPYSV